MTIAFSTGDGIVWVHVPNVVVPPGAYFFLYLSYYRVCVDQDIWKSRKAARSATWAIQGCLSGYILKDSINWCPYHLLVKPLESAAGLQDVCVLSIAIGLSCNRDQRYESFATDVGFWYQIESLAEFKVFQQLVLIYVPFCGSWLIESKRNSFYQLYYFGLVRSEHWLYHGGQPRDSPLFACHMHEGMVLFDYQTVVIGTWK